MFAGKRTRGTKVETLVCSKANDDQWVGGPEMESEESVAPNDVDAPFSSRIDGIVIGRLAAINDVTTSGVLVDFHGNPHQVPRPAISTVLATPDDVGREVALSFQRGNPLKPVVLGFVRNPEDEVKKTKTEEKKPKRGPVTIEEDGDRLIIESKKELVLRCGKASITLTRAGKVLIRGAYVLSRSSGVNRVKGGSVQIN